MTVLSHHRILEGNFNKLKIYINTTQIFQFAPWYLGTIWAQNYRNIHLLIINTYNDLHFSWNRLYLGQFYTALECSTPDHGRSHRKNFKAKFKKWKMHGLGRAGALIHRTTVVPSCWFIALINIRTYNNAYKRTNISPWLTKVSRSRLKCLYSTNKYQYHD